MFSINRALKIVHISWKPTVMEAIEKYGKKIERAINEDIDKYEDFKEILPTQLEEKLFYAFTFPMDELKVVIIGQDPYIHPEEPNGMCFSVNKGIKVPPSLRNIWKEMRSDLNIPDDVYLNSDFTYLRDQGVLLLNASLSVLESNSNHHAEIWKGFTDLILKRIGEKKKGIVYLAWGRFAQKKVENAQIDENDNKIIKDAHPSPLSAKKFFGGKYFSRINNYLGDRAIKWY